MPQILEMKQDDEGAIWVRVPTQSFSFADRGPVTLYYKWEIEEIKRKAYETAIGKIQELGREQERTDGA